MSKGKVAQQKCHNPACAKQTSNPKFCCRACSAVVTNISNPKRRPEHQCQRCHCPITSKKAFCAECTAERNAEEQRRQRNIQCYLTIGGEHIERPIERVSMARRVVFSPSFSYPQITPECTCGDLIDRLIGLCFSRPEFLRTEDAARHTALLHELKHFMARESWDPDSPVVAVQNLPIRLLDRVLAEWILAYFADDENPLMPHYALDTAKFMQTVVNGTYQFEPEHWELAPAFGDKLAERDLFRCIDREFKKRFTEHINLEVLAQVPEAVNIRYQREIILPPGSTFAFRVHRCHLSSSVGDYQYFDVSEDPAAPRFDLMGEFQLVGHILPQQPGEFHRPYGLLFYLPANWITHVIRHDRYGDEGRLIPVPQWPRE
jgi:hypothetical protein